MKLINHLRLTKLLVILGIVGSIVSIYTTNQDMGEIYPFFHWKLYSQPLGTTREYTEYRIYTKDSDTSSVFKRNPIKETKTFNVDEYVYTFNYLVSRSLHDTFEKNDYKKKLEIFVKHVIPGKRQYKIVSETYIPEILMNSNKYDTTTVIIF